MFLPQTLEKLSINQNRVKNICNLDFVLNLVIIDLSFNFVERVIRINFPPRLIELNFAFNFISAFDVCLPQTTQRVHFYQNKLSDFNFMNVLKNVVFVNLGYNFQENELTLPEISQNLSDNKEKALLKIEELPFSVNHFDICRNGFGDRIFEGKLFNGCLNLIYLNLSFNKLTDIPRFFFKKTPQLQELILRGNFLCNTLFLSAFADNCDLKIIDLQSN
jgi:Leucine-rich repeat (LRR) protein